MIFMLPEECNQALVFVKHSGVAMVAYSDNLSHEVGKYLQF